MTYVKKCDFCGAVIACEREDLIKDWGPGDFIEPEYVGYVHCIKCGHEVHYRMHDARYEKDEKEN